MGPGAADARGSDDGGSSTTETGEAAPLADGLRGRSADTSPLASGAATPSSAPASASAANGAAVAAGAGRAAEEGGGGGLGGAATRRALSAELGLGAYQRSQEDISWVPSAGDLKAAHSLAKLILEKGKGWACMTRDADQRSFVMLMWIGGGITSISHFMYWPRVVAGRDFTL